MSEVAAAVRLRRLNQGTLQIVPQGCGTAGYVRLSVEDGGRPGADTLESQKRIITQYIENTSALTLAGLWCDNGHTGTDFERPEFEKLMERVRHGEIDCIVVKDLSRFGRNYKETGNYLERIFPFLNVRFIAINDNFDIHAGRASRSSSIAKADRRAEPRIV